MKALLLALALAMCVLGMAWLALAMEVHWRQVRSDDVPPRPGVAHTLRVLGAAALLAALLICLRADHASMAALVWVMGLAGSALAVAFTLSWRPRVLAVLVAWAPRPAPRGTLDRQGSPKTAVQRARDELPHRPTLPIEQELP
jgi:hypothetical protein